MYQVRGISAVLCEATRYVAAKRCEILAQQRFSAHAVEAGQTWLERICCYAVADGYIFDVSADGGDCTCCFVALGEVSYSGFGSGERGIPGMRGHWLAISMDFR
jgi:hypothetical protein